MDVLYGPYVGLPSTSSTEIMGELCSCNFARELSYHFETYAKHRGLSNISVQALVGERFEIHRMCCVGFKDLTPEQRWHRMTFCKQLKGRYEFKCDDFLMTIIRAHKT